MSESGLLPVVLIAAALANGLIAGASLDRSVVQLPARRKIGVAAYSAYSVAHELEGVGLIWYPVLGIGSALLTIAAAVVAAASGIALLSGSPIYLAAAAAVMHTATTARAAPMNFRQRSATGDEAQLARIIDSFAKWHAARAVLQLASFAGTVVALGSIGRVWNQRRAGSHSAGATATIICAPGHARPPAYTMLEARWKRES